MIPLVLLGLINSIETWQKYFKVNKFQGNGLFRFGVLSHLLGWKWKTPHKYRVKLVPV